MSKLPHISSSQRIAWLVPRHIRNWLARFRSPQLQHQVDKIIAVLRERRPDLLISEKEIASRLIEAARWYRSDRRSQIRGGAPGLGKIGETLAGAAAHLHQAVLALGVDRKNIEDGPAPSLIRELIELKLEETHDDPERRLRADVVAIWALAKAMDNAAEEIGRWQNSPRLGLIPEGKENHEDLVAAVLREQHRWRTGAAGNPALNGFLDAVSVLWIDATGDELAVSVASDKGRTPGRPIGRVIEFLRLCQELVGENVSDDALRDRMRALKKLR